MCENEDGRKIAKDVITKMNEPWYKNMSTKELVVRWGIIIVGTFSGLWTYFVGK